MDTLNHYEGHRTICTTDDKATASLLGGHQWNIISNREDTEVYLREARNPEHYIDQDGKATSTWFQKRGLVRRVDGSLITGANSEQTAQILRCPATAGKTELKHQARELRQLCQASAPADYSLYSTRRSQVLPTTPRRLDHLDRTVPFQKSLMDTPVRSSPRCVERQLWTPRRGEPLTEPRPPAEKEMFTSVDQLKSESHLNAQDHMFAAMLRGQNQHDRPAGLASLALPEGSAVTLTSMNSTRSRREGCHPLPADLRTRNSLQRLEEFTPRDISAWSRQQDKLRRQDPFSAKPMAFGGSSGAKYDIITNERHNFWY